MRACTTTLLTSLLLLACAQEGTSTGNPKGDTGPETDDTNENPDGGEHVDNGNPTLGGFGCPAGDSTVLASVDTDTPLGFSAADILAFAGGSHEVTIRWNPSEFASYGPESGDHALTITLSHDDGEIRFVEPKENNGDGDNHLGSLLPTAPCSEWLEIDVTVTLKSDGGALDESFETTLMARSPLQAIASHQLKHDQVMGGFEITDVRIEGFMLAQLQLSMTFTPLGSSGNLSAVFEVRRGDAVGNAAAGGGLATWGVADCNDRFFGSGVGAELDQDVLGVRPNDVLELFEQKASVEVSWQSGSSTTSTLAFTPAGESACIVFDEDGLGTARISIPGTLTMQSEDGRLDGAWAGSLHTNVHADASSVSQASFELTSNGLGEPAEDGDAGAYFGFPMTDADGYDFWSVGVQLSVSASGSEPNVEPNVMGELRLTGFELAECAGGDPDRDPAPDPDTGSAGMGGGSMTAGSAGSAEGGGSPGCRGSDPFELEAATLR
jgi:hypothetical protein